MIFALVVMVILCGAVMLLENENELAVISLGGLVVVGIYVGLSGMLLS